MSARLPKRARAVIVGGGITGLAAARHVQAGLPEDETVYLLEASSRIGGHIQSPRTAHGLLEAGPDSLVLHKPAGLKMCRLVGLEDELIYPSASSSGLEVIQNGRRVRVPDGFFLIAPTRLQPFLRSPLFSWAGKLRVGAEMLLPGRSSRDDESIRSFVVRRFGLEAYERVAEPVLGGLFTADAAEFSAELAVPKFRELERRFGSITRGLLSLRRSRQRSNPQVQRGKPAAFVTLRRGLESLVDSVRNTLPTGAVHTRSPVSHVRYDHEAGMWRLQVNGNELSTESLILACPAFVAAPLLADLDRGLGDELSSLQYASCTTINLIYRRSQVGDALDSFGFFVPKTEKLPIFAAANVSVKFPERVADDLVLIRTFVGGALHPEALDGEDSELASASHRVLERLMQIEGQPISTTVHRNPQSMPQFPVGFGSCIERIDELVERHPGLQLAGSSRGAFGLPDCISSGEEAAERVLSWLGSQKERPESAEVAIR